MTERKGAIRTDAYRSNSTMLAIRGGNTFESAVNTAIIHGIPAITNGWHSQRNAYSGKVHITSGQGKRLLWINSSTSSSPVGRVETAPLMVHTEMYVLVRNTLQSEILVYTKPELEAFLDGAKKREFEGLV